MFTARPRRWARLGAHPHIVTVFDLGEEDGQPYLVTRVDGGRRSRGPDRGGAPSTSCARVRRSLELAHGHLPRPRLRPRAGSRPPRPQAGQRLADGGRPRPRSATSGSRSPLERVAPDAGGHDRRHRLLPAAGAGAGRRGHAARRPLLPRRDALRAASPAARRSSATTRSRSSRQHINTPPVAPDLASHPTCPRALEALDPAPARQGSSGAARVGARTCSPRSRRSSRAESAEPAETRPRRAHALDGLAGGVFVGRQQELGTAQGGPRGGALRRRADGHCWSGEPGIGKTRTAQELATYARLRSAEVLWGRCYESEGAPPYWPWVQALRAYVRECDPEQLRSRARQRARPRSRRSSPDVALRLPRPRRPPALEDAGQARFRLFDSAHRVPAETPSPDQPLVLVLDDLHWADAGTAAAARVPRAGARRAPGCSSSARTATSSSRRRHPLVADARRAHPRAPLRAGRPAWPRARDDVGRFIEATSGVTPPDGAGRGCATRRPRATRSSSPRSSRLLVQEDDLSRERPAPRESWSVRIPEGVREVIGQRLDRLSQRCNETLIGRLRDRAGVPPRGVEAAGRRSVRGAVARGTRRGALPHA